MYCPDESASAARLLMSETLQMHRLSLWLLEFTESCLLHLLRQIKIQTFDRFGDPVRILFMKLFATVTNDYNEWLPGVIFLREGVLRY